MEFIILYFFSLASGYFFSIYECKTSFIPGMFLNHIFNFLSPLQEHELCIHWIFFSFCVCSVSSHLYTFVLFYFVLCVSLESLFHDRSINAKSVQKQCKLHWKCPIFQSPLLEGKNSLTICCGLKAHYREACSQRLAKFTKILWLPDSERAVNR